MGCPDSPVDGANGVSAFFHGHDHVYAYEKRDGVVYQSVPSPAMTGSGFSQYYTGQYTLQVLPNPGHLRVTVSAHHKRPWIISRPPAGPVNYSYTILADTENDPPTDISLSNSTVAEGQPVGTVVGTFSTADPNPGDTHTYSLVAGAGDTDNGAFTIAGNELRTAEVFDYDAKNSYSIRVRTTDNGVGNLTYEEALTITVNSATSTIAVNDFDNYRVFQRDIGGTSKSVTISGTYSNMDWSRVEARVLQHGTSTAVVGWTTIDTTPGGGTFSGSLIVPQGGWYNIEIRALDSTGSVLGSSRGTNKWGVGMLILCIGQSNMSGHGQPPFTVATSDLAVNYSNAGIWEHLADPYDDDSPAGAVDNDNSTAGGSMIPALANSLLQTFNFPIAFVPVA